ncbi:MAG: glycosyltransferase family 2 protein [Bacteroidetes bacterium]|nr:MAG: glycosyltransferase family 2 protein [Bacteroidota bacterium]REJ99702.1 MAG: glycosyltransferase family 2 protein [Bacteroidota bacterium]REK33935.1 MAG: glycosyltransferase family 2 protein [Bacteroidota bacterium]REK47701.1 MAG: glycosyltransferase family 2 protein [Bacteroidota bacterium]
MDRIRFSAVIPTYNRRNMIGHAIDSVLRQSYPAHEIIVVDDGSTDGTIEYLKELYSNFPNISLIRQENLERGAARNRGLNDASGDYVVFLDSDDKMLSQHLEILSRKILELNGPDFIATKYRFESDAGLSNADIMEIPEGFHDYHLFLQGNPLACNICVKKSNPNLALFEEDRKYAIKEDWMFLLQNTRYSKVYIIDAVSLVMHDHPERSMRSGNTLIINKTKLAREWIRERIPLSRPDLKKLDSHISYFCAIHSYIDGKRVQALRYVINAIKSGGFRLKYFVLASKITLGKKLVDKLKGVRP